MIFLVIVAVATALEYGISKSITKSISSEVEPTFANVSLPNQGLSGGITNDGCDDLEMNSEEIKNHFKGNVTHYVVEELQNFSLVKEPYTRYEAAM